MDSLTVDAGAAPSAVERRLAAMHMRPTTAIAVITAMLVLVADSQALALVPLLNTMTEQYKLTAPQATIVLAIPALVAAGGVPVLTRVAERIGMRLFLLIGVIFTVVGNMLCAMAPGYGLLLTGRALLGFSAAVPIGIALLRESSKSEKQTNNGLAVITAAVGVSVAISFLLGGVILKLNGTVHTVFWVMAVLGAVAFVMAWVMAPDYQTKVKDPADVVGAILLVIALTAVAVYLSYGSTWHWTSGKGLTVLIVGLVVFAGWVWWELASKHPLIDIRKTFSRATVPAYFYVGLWGTIAVISNLAVTNYAEFNAKMPIPLPAGSPAKSAPLDALVKGVDYGFGDIVLTASLFLMPTAFFILLGGGVVGRIITKLGTKNSMFVASGLGILAFAFLAIDHTQQWENYVGMGIWGMSYALGFAAGSAAYVHAAKEGEGSLFAAAATVVTGTVGSLAAPVFTAVLYASAVTLGTTQIPTVASYNNVWWVCALGAVIGLALVLMHKKREYQGDTTAMDAALEV
ncbi:MAG: MFS transporter [Microbacteriaceae bacterium]|nr:MFS transporter [Microbacteriaceae bacterium]MCL2794318.1 MFS transporter [Microbacteriaceae bacterium]